MHFSKKKRGKNYGVALESYLLQSVSQAASNAAARSSSKVTQPMPYRTPAMPPPTGPEGASIIGAMNRANQTRVAANIYINEKMTGRNVAHDVKKELERITNR